MEDNKKKGLGMVLEGGGMRGLYTAGVLDELMEQGIYADSTVGVSAGAIFGCPGSWMFLTQRHLPDHP